MYPLGGPKVLPPWGCMPASASPGNVDEEPPLSRNVGAGREAGAAGPGGTDDPECVTRPPFDPSCTGTLDEARPGSVSCCGMTPAADGLAFPGGRMIFADVACRRVRTISRFTNQSLLICGSS